MKFFAASALFAVASATNAYYGGARVLNTGYTTGLTGFNTGLTGFNTGLTGFNTYGGYNKVLAVAQPTIAVQKFGLAHTGLLNTGYATNLGYQTGYGYNAAAVAPLAVQSQHTVQHYDVPSGGQITPISVEIDANPIPVNMLFKSASSQLAVQQAHQGQQGSVQESSSEDEVHTLKHSVIKPVLQEIREVITPFRKITQEVQPVQESIQTLVARGNAAKVLTVAQPAVQTVAYAQPAVQTVAVAQPAVQTVAYAQPAVQTVAYAQPAVQTVAYAQPAVQTVAVAQPAVQTVAYAQPAVQTVAVAQPTIAVQKFGLAHTGLLNTGYTTGVRAVNTLAKEY